MLGPAQNRATLLRYMLGSGQVRAGFAENGNSQSLLFPKPTTRTTLWREADLKHGCSHDRFAKRMLGFYGGWGLAEKSPHSLRVALSVG